MHIFVVEDERTIRQELKLLLENAMYQVTAPDTFENIAAQAVESRPDLVLLDVNLPGISGFDVCMQIRARTEVPVIFLTSRTDSMDELNGILKGGDDYITKPYQAPILLARIAAVLKRTKGAEAKENVWFTKNGVQLDTLKCCLVFQEQRVELTKNEMKILYLLFRHQGEFVARMDLIEFLWENQIFIDDNTLSVHITGIRKKLASIGVENFIETKRGIGYRI
ncbi:MAG: response regulator transcription factor [Bacteroidales bacterium]|nr:response regulator transcription factor [Clostridium sp.]MCM1204589.1 response regulator transcription factor [Bacteroidales bacterium]